MTQYIIRNTHSNSFMYRFHYSNLYIENRNKNLKVMEITKTDYIKQYIIDNDLFTLPSRTLAKSVLNANP